MGPVLTSVTCTGINIFIFKIKSNGVCNHMLRMPPLKKTTEERNEWFDSYSVDLALRPSGYGPTGAVSLVAKYSEGGFKIHIFALSSQK